MEPLGYGNTSSRCFPVLVRCSTIITVRSPSIKSLTHGSLIFIGVLRIYNVLYFLLLEDLSIFLIVFSGLLSAKWAVVHNTIEPALEVLCSSKLNFQFLEVNFQNERTVSLGCMNRKNDLHASMFDQSIHTGVVIACFDAFCKTIKQKTVVMIDNASIHTSEAFEDRIPHWKKQG